MTENPISIRPSDTDWNLFDGDGPQINPLETFQTFDEAFRSAGNLVGIWTALGRSFGYGVATIKEGQTKLGKTQFEYWIKASWDNEDKNFIQSQTYIVRPAVIHGD